MKWQEVSEANRILRELVDDPAVRTLVTDTICAAYNAGAEGERERSAYLREGFIELARVTGFHPVDCRAYVRSGVQAIVARVKDRFSESEARR